VPVMGTGTGDTCKEATGTFWSNGYQTLPAMGSELNALSARW